MDSPGKKTPCKNSTYGCSFASSSIVDMLNHFQGECTFHPVRCFKCNKTVQKINFAKHYLQFCKGSSAPPCPAPGEVPDVEETKSNPTMSEELHFPQEGVRERDVAAAVAELKAIKEQGDAINEIRSILRNSDRASSPQFWNWSFPLLLSLFVCWLVYFCAEPIGQRVERLERLVEDCISESTFAAHSMYYYVTKDVSEGVAATRVEKEEQQHLKGTVEKRGNFFGNLSRSVMTAVEGIERLECWSWRYFLLSSSLLVFFCLFFRDVNAVAHRSGDMHGPRSTAPSTVHWYVENVSHYIEKAKTGRSYVKSEVFVVRGYSARLLFEVEKDKGDLCVGLFFHLCRGPRDSLLQWPFRIPYTLSLIHPKDASKTKEFKITPPSTGPECFGKPKNEENKGLGTGNLCNMEAARAEGFIENDAFCVSVTLHE